MILSVIIVNYRVRYFLELCLRSLEKTLANAGPAEIIVIDNHSGDGSIEALAPLFPTVRFIANPENAGFAKANNQALREARGEFILFLNPDTIVPEDFAQICLDFLQATPPPAQRTPRTQPTQPATGLHGIGALGVRMIDGSGLFLPESRRGFPNPWVAFCRLAGLSALFPRSRIFAQYYLGHLRPDMTTPAPVLSGACLWTRRDILREVGGFDEQFFMYAEDIDLSYRIGQAGYTNYYLAGVTIVHFKGESTPKDSRYIRQFYKAMSQFRRKHFNRGLPAVLNLGMEAAIWIRAAISGVSRVAKRQPVAEPAGPRSDDQPAGIGPDVRIWLIGDPGETAHVKSLLNPATLASSEHDATHLLFCEGPAFSFRECIAALETSRRRRPETPVLFHAASTRSAVGSADRDGQGETLRF
jgi:N-acetylglucosaminyl-diphospho-decaprenol L-rhamnosyltransferase